MFKSSRNVFSQYASTVSVSLTARTRHAHVRERKVENRLVLVLLCAPTLCAVRVRGWRGVGFLRSDMCELVVGLVGRWDAPVCVCVEGPISDVKDCV